MKTIETGIQGLVIVEPTVYADDRGAFFEAHSVPKFTALGIEPGVMQINQSVSRKGVLRGLHFQRPPHDQTKLVRCVRGRLWDVAVDIRRGSPTFGRWFGTELSAENRRMLYVPTGFAHGFYALDECELLYLCGRSAYHKAAEGGLRWNDPAVGIEWPLADAPLLNERDRLFPGLEALVEAPAFVFEGVRA